MPDSPHPGGEGSQGRRGKHRGRFSPAGWFPRGGWKIVDPLYFWSAVVGLFLALALIAVAQIIRTGPLR
jgi:hypothetical protein